MGEAVRPLTATIHREGDRYTAHCPELGVTACAGNVREAFARLGEAVESELTAGAITAEESASLEEALDEVDRGETVPADEVFADLRARIEATRR